MTAAAIQLEFLRDHLKGFCDLWNKPQRLFLDRYFEFIAARVEAQRAPLSAALEKFGGLYDYMDWSLSAPRPLPRALIRAPGREGEFLSVDFAFWLDGRVLAVVLAGSGTPTRNERAKRRALEDCEVEIVEISLRALARDGAGYLIEGPLPRDFTAFWESEAMPSSPFKGSSLGEIEAL